MEKPPIDVSAAAEIPLPPAEEVSRALRAAREACPNRKIVVLDDDPTGVQTVHDVPVYTDWEPETLRSALSEPGDMFFVLTNSRGLAAEETARLHTRLAENLAEASRETGRDFLLVSRGDSTLRGHYPLETDTLRRTLEASLPIRFNGEILMPFFAEGGRYTIGNTHYVREDDRLIPVGLTEFARDTAFSFRSSDLTEWIEERTGGICRSADVCCIPLEQLRAADIEGITSMLLSVHDFGRIVVNAADDTDAEVFAAALWRAESRGGHFLCRCAAGLVRALGNIEKRPLLTARDLGVRGAAGLVIVGSHVRKTTRQLERLLEAEPGLAPICFDVSGAVNGIGLSGERDRVLSETDRALSLGQTAVVFTDRTVLRPAGDRPEENLRLSAEISRSLCSLVSALHTAPGFLIAKGGITSSDVGTLGLGVRRSVVLGQLLPGVPVWRTGPESRFPGMSYVIFPGNVGNDDSLLLAVQKLRGEEGRSDAE